MADFDAAAPEPLLDPPELGAGSLEIILPLPLERRMRLGNEGRKTQGNVAPPGIVPEDRSDLLDQLRQFLEILLVLRRVPDHEVEFDAGPARRHRPIDGLENVFLGDAFVDHVAQALAPGLRREREARLTNPAHRLREAYAEGIGAERRETHAHTTIHHR